MPMIACLRGVWNGICIAVLAAKERFWSWCVGLVDGEEVDSGYWVIRIVRWSRWRQIAESSAGHEDVEYREDFRLRQREVGLSVFRASGKRDITEIATRFSLTCRGNVSHFDYVAVPERCLQGFELRHRPRKDLIGYLSDRHYEYEPTTAADLDRIADAFALASEGEVRRMKDRELAKKAVEVVENEPEVSELVSSQWVNFIGKCAKSKSDVRG